MQHDKQIAWGKILVGAAIAAGAVAVIAFCPETTASIGTAIETSITKIFGGLGSVGTWIAEKTASLVTTIQAHPGLAITTALGAGGLAASATLEDPVTRKTAHLEDESFTMREDMRRMQALMAARMAATGYQPAMATVRAR
jgi:hypothetical protein